MYVFAIYKHNISIWRMFTFSHFNYLSAMLYAICFIIFFDQCVQKSYRIKYIAIKTNFRFWIVRKKIVTRIYEYIPHHTFLSKMTKRMLFTFTVNFTIENVRIIVYLYMGDRFSPLSRLLKYQYTLTTYWDGDLVLWGSHLNNIDNKFEGIS